jgi:sigma-B regulation protein RsbQ
MLFAHGFGCDQNMWRYVAPAFADDHRVVLFDHVGAGGSDLSAYDPERYGSLEGYARDVVEICAALRLEDAVFVGHSVSAMIGVLAAARAPERIGCLVLVGPSPRYIDEEGYTGGFSRADIAQLLESLNHNFLGWSSAMAPVIMGNPDRPELGEELTASFCRTDPDLAERFARVTFLSDNRADLATVQVPTLVLQCSEDAIAPYVVGEYVHRAIPGSRLHQLAATGHCPNLSAPEATTAAIDAFEFHRVALGLYDFVYGELCDWYLEIVKPRLYAGDNEQVAAFALHVLGETLALAHPVIPFVTEELWSHMPGADGLLMARRWPLPDETRRDPAAEEEVGRAIAAVQELRGWRDRVGAAPGSVLPARLEAGGYERTSPHVARLARVEWSADGGEPAATVAVPGGSIAVLPSDAVDLGAEGRRVDERRRWLAAEIDRAERKLGNQGFVAKAPPPVVQAERDKLDRFRAELATL